MLSAETMNERAQKRSITEYLNEIISVRGSKDINKEFVNLHFDNDMVTTFFDSVDKLSDDFCASFIEELARDMDQLLTILF